MTFSWTLAFKSSYFSKTWLKMRVALDIISTRAAASTTTATKKMELSRGLMKKHITMLHSSISGARTAMRRHI